MRNTLTLAFKEVTTSYNNSQVNHFLNQVRFNNKMLGEGWDGEIKGMSLFGVPSRNMKWK